ncbi:MAG: hypothetical protein FWD71_17070 [Oscillospiraceae bacterium]|nr:hypothetical protein [Oscillospiraceae bacterium]
MVLNEIEFEEPEFTCEDCGNELILAENSINSKNLSEFSSKFSMLAYRYVASNNSIQARCAAEHAEKSEKLKIFQIFRAYSAFAVNGLAISNMIAGRKNKSAAKKSTNG